ncbi:MAG: hypothetical protein ACI4TB_01950, partial [Lachnospiraceae bacterium]
MIGLILGAGAMALLTGCGTGVPTVGTNETQTENTVTEAEPTATPEATELQLMEQKYAEGNFEPADYIALAALYGENGQVLKQRDM